VKGCNNNINNNNNNMVVVAGNDAPAKYLVKCVHIMKILQGKTKCNISVDRTFNSNNDYTFLIAINQFIP
jgi:hypothetical protein